MRTAFLTALFTASSAAASMAQTVTGYSSVSGLFLDAYMRHQPIVTEVLHLGRQTMLEPGEMSFTPALWLGTGEHLTGGFGFSYQTATSGPNGYGLAIGALDDRGTSAGVAVSVRRSGYSSRRLRIVVQGVLGYQWELDSLQNAVDLDEVPFGGFPSDVFLIEDARWINGYAHAIGEFRLGAFRYVLDLGLLASSARVDGFVLDGDFELDEPLSRSETFARLTFGTGLALDAGALSAFFGGVRGDGDGIIQMSVMLRAR